MARTLNKSEALANEIREGIKAGKVGDTLITVMLMSHCFNVNSNVMSHAFRKLEKEGILAKDYRSCVGNWVWKLIK